MHKFHVGQRWRYKTREQDLNSTLLIGEIQNQHQQTPIIHVLVDKVKSSNSTRLITINHMPFSKLAIDASVLELIEADVAIPSDLKDGIALWKNNKGGVFELTVSEAIDEILSVSAEANKDAFDNIVMEMRSQKSEDLIQVLYHKLFALQKWFFICEPDNNRAPVQWIFPEGMNTSPALLVFTSQERATSAAISLGIYADNSSISIMPATVDQVIEWISGSECSNTWMCFNLTRNDFPLYCDYAIWFFENN